MIPEKFLKWRKVFGKIELERIPMRKIWDHAIDLKEMFVPQKGRSPEFCGRLVKKGVY